MKTRARRITFTTLSVALLATTATSTASYGQESKSPLDETPVAIHGTFPEELLDLQVFTEEPDRGIEKGESLAITPLKGEIVESGGKFEVRIDPKDIAPEFFDEKGVVQFRVFGRGTKESWTTSTSVRAVAQSDNAERLWTDPVMSEAILSEAITKQRSEVEVADRERGVQVTPASASLAMSQADISSSAFALEENYAASGDLPIATMAVCNNVYMGSSQERSTTIATTYPKNVSTAALEITSSLGEATASL